MEGEEGIMYGDLTTITEIDRLFPEHEQKILDMEKGKGKNKKRKMTNNEKQMIACKYSYS